MDHLHVYPSSEAKREENAPSYSFFMEIMTCKEVKQLALVLLFAGMMSLLIGASSAVGIAAATTVLASIGVSATTATIGGGITAAIGLGLRLFKPTDPISKSLALQAHVMTEIEKGSSDVPASQSMSRV